MNSHGLLGKGPGAWVHILGCDFFVLDLWQFPRLLCLGFLICKMGLIPALKVSYEE